MTTTDLKVGDKVRLVKPFENTNEEIVPTDLVGTVIKMAVSPCPYPIHVDFPGYLNGPGLFSPGELVKADV